MDLGAQPTFAVTRLAPRPPRVAVVVPAGDRWDYWVRLALYDASSRWGGAGYVVIPHTDGAVHPLILEAVVAYDPDFVVELQPTVQQFEAAHPGQIPVAREGEVLVGEERAELVEGLLDDGWQLAGSATARDHVSSVCTPHRQSLGPDWISERLSLLTVGRNDENLPSAPQPSDEEPAAVVACPPEWAGPLAVAVAARFGSDREPQPGAPPSLGDSTSQRLVSCLLSPASGPRNVPPPNVLLDGDAGRSVLGAGQVSRFDRTLVGLTTLMRAPRIDRTTVLVVGDAADDFALAMLWDRIYGNSIWVPSVLHPEGKGPLVASARLALTAIAHDAARWKEQLHLASCSMPRQALEGLAEHWGLQDELDTLEERRKNEKRRAGIFIGPPEHTRDGIRMLGVREQYDRYANLPVTVDADGTRQLPVPPPTVVPDEPTLAASLPSSWQIDLEFPDQRMPRGRGIDGAVLVHEDDPEADAWVRSGRDGFTIHSHRFGLILAGASLEATIAKPRVRELALLPWVQEMARAASLKAGLSDAGRRAQIVERLWGGRTELMDAMSGPLRPLLRAFRPSAPRTDEAYPVEGHGVVLAGDGYLSYAGLAAAAPSELKSVDLRTHLDELLEFKVLTRGLVLACGACQKPGFVSVDHLSQANECLRCNEVSPLVQPRWRKPRDEPIWFYRLHWAIAELFDQNGDVPLLLAAELRRSAGRRHYTDLGEVEFVSGEDRAPVAECDLVALRKGQLLVAEAKSNDTLDSKGMKRRVSASKRAQVGRALRADEIVLATTQERWQQRSIDEMRCAIAELTWPTGRGPRLRLVTGLGGTPKHEILDAPER